MSVAAVRRSRMVLGAIAGALVTFTTFHAPAAEPGVAAGSFHSLGLRSDGRLLAWGNDSAGQLGQGRLLWRSTPASVAGTAGVVSVSAGSGFGVAVTGDGNVLGWGANDYGQLGSGSFGFRGNDVVRAAISGVREVATSRSGVTALRSDGSVWAWGARPLGDGSSDESATPRAIGLDEVVQISASTTHTLALKRDGTVWGWGNPSELDFSGDSGLRHDSYYRATRLAPLTDVRHVAAGESYTLFVKSDGSLWGWGSNFRGTLGGLAGGRIGLPTRIPDVSGVRAIAAGNSHVLALREDGSVLSWGVNSAGQLGRPTSSAFEPSLPAPVPGLSNIVAVAAGQSHSLALAANGIVWAWGRSANGEAGQPGGVVVAMPTRVPGITGASSISARDFFSLSAAGGTVHAWGDNSRQQLASGPAQPHDQTTPIVVPGIDDVVMAAGTTWNSYALRSDGSLWGWGRDPVAVPPTLTQLVASPARIEGLPRIVAVSGRSTHVLALDDQGRVWSWGGNIRGQLGNGTTSNSLSPALVQTPERIVAVSAGYSHSLALTVSGRVLGWGANHLGQLADGTTADRLTPVYATGLAPVNAVSAGGDFSLAKTGSGEVWAWGSARSGMLGIGDPDATRYPTPQRVLLPEPARLVSAGAAFAMAVTNDGGLWGWGEAAFGQLGLGGGEALLSRWSPIRLPIETPVEALATSGLFALAITGNAAVVGFGWNSDAELGDGTLIDRMSPVLTAGIGGMGVLDLTPQDPVSPPSSLQTRFSVATFGDAKSSRVTLDARIFFGAADVGTFGSVFTFAIAPADMVLGGAPDPAVPLRMHAKREGKNTPVQCVLAQLNAAGQLVGVSAANLQAYVTGVLSGQGQAVSILNGVPAVNIGGATFFVGYGPNAGTMLNGGNNRGVVTFPGIPQCKPEAPQTGWWWNPAEDGRGFSIERRGPNLFFAAFLYDASGRSTWHVSSGPVSLDGSLYVGSMLSARGGQTLGGPYTSFPTLRNDGPITLAFNTAGTGTLVWPGGAVPIQRFNIVPNGVSQGPAPNVPESGWWWNEQEAGRGFFLEWQGSMLDIAGYMYDDAGNPVWYLTVGNQSADGRSFSGNWWSYGNGMTLSGPWRQHVRTNANVAPLAITFTGPDSALMTLPNNRTTTLRRHRF